MAEPMVACGYYHTIFLKNNGTVWGCGYNASGQLGLGDTTNRLTIEIINIENIKQIVCGGRHTIFIKNDNTVWGCGYNGVGQLGLGDTKDRTMPVKINITGVKQVACGNDYTIFLKNDGTVWGCGYNGLGQFGLNDTTDRKTLIQLSINNVKQVECGYDYTIFLKNDGTVLVCGYNGVGQLGLGDTTTRTTPAQLTITNVKQVVCGNNHTIFIKNDSTMWSCGGNNRGQLGLGDTNNRTIPVKINITNMKQVVCGDCYTFFIKNDGTVWCCGYNAYGQLGLGDTTNRLTPVQLSITDVKQVACGYSHTIYLKNEGTIWGCGYNGLGQLGLGDTTNKKTPTLIGDLLAQLMLLYDSDSYKTIIGNALQILTSQQINKANIEQNGFTEISSVKSVWGQLEEGFKLFVYHPNKSNDNVKVSHLPPAQLLQQTEDIDLSAYSNIKKMTLTATGSEGTIKLALSFDSGVTWQTYANGWQDIALTTDALLANGLTPETLSVITQEQWTEVKADTLRIAYCLSKTAITDDIAIDGLTITGDTAAWNRAKHMTDYDYEYPNTTTLVVHLLKDGSYKINYMEAK